jgi:hypothetical protein
MRRLGGVSRRHRIVFEIVSNFLVEREQMAKELNSVVEGIKRYVVQPEIKRRHSKTVVVFKF